MNKTIIVSSFLILAAIQFSGCSYSRFPIADISSNTSITHMDAKSVPFYKVKLKYQDKEIEASIESGIVNKEIKDFINEIKANAKPETKAVTLNIAYIFNPGIKKIELSDNKTFSVPLLHNFKNSAGVFIPVEFPNGRKYLAYLDTGCTVPILMTSDIVLKNKLCIIPFGSDDNNNNSNGGLCHIPELNVGSGKIIVAMASYEQKQWQFRFLNFPVYKTTDIILGRPFMKFFDYVMFDNVKHKAVFSKDGAFKPDNPKLWSSYSFSEDPNNGDTIMVDIPIAGKVLTIAFDSCGGNLTLNKQQWETIKQSLDIKRLKKTKYTIYDGTNFPCQKATVSELQIANKIHKNVDLLFGDEKSLCILGLDCFDETVIVLDYVNKLFWVKKAK